MRGANSRRETVNPSRFNEFDAPVHWNQFTFDVAPNVVLNSADGFEFTFNAGALLFSKGHDFLAETEVLLVAQAGSIEQSRIPSRLQAGFDHFDIWTMIQMQRGRNRSVGSHFREHLLKQFGSPHFHRLDGDLNDHRGFGFHRGIQDRRHRQVVHDIEGPYAVSGFKGRLQDFSE